MSKIPRIEFSQPIVATICASIGIFAGGSAISSEFEAIRLYNQAEAITINNFGEQNLLMKESHEASHDALIESIVMITFVSTALGATLPWRLSESPERF